MAVWIYQEFNVNGGLKSFKGPLEQRNNASVMNVWLQDLSDNSEMMKKANFLPQDYYVFFDRHETKLIDHIY